MYQLDVITLFPEIVSSGFANGVISKAMKNGLVELRNWNPRDFTQNKHKTVDDRPYGGGPGMVLMHQPLCAAIQKARKKQKN